MSLDFSLSAVREQQVYSGNITHNLTEMADACGLYKCLWRPEENGFTVAAQIVPLLQEGLAKLIARPKYYKRFDSPNGWGVYENFVQFVRDTLAACEANPDATISSDV
jgi:hypothetical protein